MVALKVLRGSWCSRSLVHCCMLDDPLTTQPSWPFRPSPEIRARRRPSPLKKLQPSHLASRKTGCESVAKLPSCGSCHGKRSALPGLERQTNQSAAGSTASKQRTDGALCPRSLALRARSLSESTSPTHSHRGSLAAETWSGSTWKQSCSPTLETLHSTTTELLCVKAQLDLG